MILGREQAGASGNTAILPRVRKAGESATAQECLFPPRGYAHSPFSGPQVRQGLRTGREDLRGKGPCNTFLEGGQMPPPISSP